MKVEQLKTLLANVLSEVTGKTELANEDLQKIIDAGAEAVGNNVDNYVKSLVNHIGKVIFVNRPYAGSVPSVLMDGWEFGSILEKVSTDLLAAEENDTWNLMDKKQYSQDTFYKPTVTAKFFNSKTTFEIPLSITERQVKESFSNAEQLNGFISMLYNAVEKSMTVYFDSLVMRTINSMTARTLASETATFGESGSQDYGKGSTAKAVNLLFLYNQGKETELKAADAIYDPDFIRFASYVMNLTADRLKTMSTAFNIGGKQRFTPSDMLHTVLLSDFAAAAKTYLYSDTYNADNVLLPKAETVPSWQGQGTKYNFDSVSGIDVKIGETDTVKLSGILGVMFDRDALGVTNLDRRVTTTYNAKAEFFNNFFKFEAGFFNDTNENFVVFYVKDKASEAA